MQLTNGIEILLPLGLERVLLSGGEPTLHSEFNDVLDLVGEYKQLSFGIITNGTVHNEKLINILNSNDKFTLQISLDGSDEEKNAITRGKDNFDKTIQFAKRIRNKQPKPLLKMVVTQNNIDDVAPFFRLAVSLGFTPEFAFVYKLGNGNDDWENKSIHTKQKLKVIRLIEQLNMELNTEALLPLCTDKCPYVKDADNMSICIKTDGTINPCQILYDDKYALGNICHFDISEFTDNVERFMDIARKRTAIDYGCSKCMLKDVCGKGCAAMAFNLTGCHFENDGECMYRKALYMKDIIY
jgi:radical SAM protein with 4Fe4S-binding SPASM domain